MRRCDLDLKSRAAVPDNYRLQIIRNMNKGSIVELLCSDLIAKNRDINGLLYSIKHFHRRNEFDSM